MISSVARMRRRTRTRQRSCVTAAIAVVMLGLPAAARAACSTALLCPTPAPPAPDPGTCTITGQNYVDNGCLLDFGTRPIILHNTAKLLTAATGASFGVRASSITIRGTVQAYGGAVTLEAVGGNVYDASNGAVRTEKVSNSPGKIDVRHAGTATLRASGAVALLGQDLNADGGDEHDGGVISVKGASITTTSPIHANGTNGGDGGFVVLESTGNVLLDGTVEAAGEGGGSTPGAGGNVSVEAGGTLSISKAMSAAGQNGGAGGDVWLRASGAATLSHNVSASGAGSAAGAEGGSITLDAASASISGALSATATTGARAGNVRITARTGSVSTTGAGTINATGGDGGGEGGRIEIIAADDATLNGTITANAGGTSSLGGEIYVRTRDVLTVGATFEARSTTAAGEQGGAIIDLTGCSIVLNGSVKTRNSTGTGQNRLQYVTSLSGSGVQLLADSAGANLIVCACPDTNADGACDSQTCTSAPSFSNVTETPARTYAREVRTCS